MITSYHNHTKWSDGWGTVAETLEAARVLELDEVGVSDHWVLHPEGRTPRWSMDPDRLAEYVAAVREAGEGATPTLRLGLEVDWFPEHAEAIATRLAEHEFDFLIGSVHTVEDFRLDSYPALWLELEVEERDAMHRRYWLAIADMARSGLFDIAAHLDLTKKFKQRPTVDLAVEIEAALDAIAAADMAVELNTSGWGLPCEDAYPSADLLRRCRARGIPALINADAHDPAYLCQDFECGAARLLEVGYEEVVVFEGRRRRAVPLALD